MLAEYKRKANIGVGIGLVLQVMGNILIGPKEGVGPAPLGWACSLNGGTRFLHLGLHVLFKGERPSFRMGSLGAAKHYWAHRVGAVP